MGRVGYRGTTSRAFAFAASVFAASAAVAQTQPIENVTVIATTMLPGTGVGVDKLPESIETLTAGDLREEGLPSLTSAANDRLGSISINDNLDDPFQPDILYRGFTASPVLGTPEGLAVFQNGVRINEAFGDGVNWDLVPDLAVARVDVVSANPVYGLNALGGAVIVTMKDGTAGAGVDGEFAGGSFGRREEGLGYSAQSGRWTFFAAEQVDALDGWRESSPDQIARVYSSASWHSENVNVALSLSAADNSLGGESPAPVQELNVDRSLVFTNPQAERNRLVFPVLNAGYTAGDTFSLQANVFYRGFWQRTINGNTTNYEACTPAPGVLCQPGGTTPVTTASGASIPDLSLSGTIPIGEIDFQEIDTSTFGGSLQLADSAALFGDENEFVLGTSYAQASTNFGSQAELGTVSPSLRVGASGYFVSTPEGAAGTATPVALSAINQNFGVFATDTLDLGAGFALTASARLNEADIQLTDRRGTALNGRSRYERFNPALGMTKSVASDATFYAGYAEGNRTPSPDELECANPAAPCLLPSTLSSDPPLKQVVSRTIDAGLRGTDVLSAESKLFWHLDLFRTAVDDDIYGVATSISSGFFENIGSTRRQGADLGMRYVSGRFSGWASYDYLDAAFESSLVLSSPFNAAANAFGDIEVRPGDRLPGIPKQRLKAGADYAVTPAWSLGAVLVGETSQFLRGDESNSMKPLAGFLTVNLHSKLRLTDTIEVFCAVSNLFDAKYANFGELGDPSGVGAPGVPKGAGVDYRFESPAAPRSVMAGVQIQF